MNVSYAKKALHIEKTHGEKSFECHLCPYKTARKDMLVSHQKVHTKTSSDQVTNIEPKNETKTQPSSKPKETQQRPKLKRKISHQESVRPSKYLRQQNIINPDDNEQFLYDIQDLQNLLSHLAAKDFSSLLKEQRPNTKWVIERIVNLRLHLIMTTTDSISHLTYLTTSRTIAISLV